MDVNYFLKSKTEFIRFFFDEAVKPFNQIQSQIDLQQPPFDNPPYSEDPEPAFLEEWLDAEMAKGIVGVTSISLLSDCLKGYFESLRTRVIGFSIRATEKKKLFSEGFVSAYRTVLGEILQTDWSDCDADLELIEQIVLARNSSQHVIDITTFQATHSKATLKKFARPIFVRDYGLAAEDDSLASFFEPEVEISREKLFSAILEVEKLADFIDARIDRAYEWRQSHRSN
jgi:hypothetical protein